VFILNSLPLGTLSAPRSHAVMVPCWQWSGHHVLYALYGLHVLYALYVLQVLYILTVRGNCPARVLACRAGFVASRRRYQTATSGGGAAPEQALQDACRQALLFAQRSNAFSVAHTARWQLVRSWQAVVEIVFSERSVIFIVQGSKLLGVRRGRL
jgi:hypothetical protein